ncbi:hypothetical protein T01_6289 [Trichinella spiralis]|uniref:Uncharacterized protein n=1 Tax=Trichinella spiralis TaxID=6334 RepID=A0A0V1BT46_TRISP|nr:hypothetical protein T01_6289 [Trichinella spiralis]
MIARASRPIWAYLPSAAASVHEWNAIGTSLPHGSLWVRTHSTLFGEGQTQERLKFLLNLWPWDLVDGFHFTFGQMDSFSVDSVSKELYTVAHNDAFSRFSQIPASRRRSNTRLKTSNSSCCESATVNTSLKYETTSFKLANKESKKRWKIPGTDTMLNWSRFALKTPLCAIIVCSSAEASSTSSC